MVPFTAFRVTGKEILLVPRLPVPVTPLQQQRGRRA